jgi:predicted ATPase
MIGHLLTGISRVLTADLSEGRTQLDRAIALYDPAEHRPLATRFGHDIRASALSWRAVSLWALGYPEAALADTGHALRAAREIGHAATSMYALSHTSLTLIYRGDHVAASTLIDELVALADQKGTLFWKGYGMLLHGWLQVLTGDAAKAIDIISSGIAAVKSTGATAYAPWYLSNLASAYAELGQFDDARRCIGEAMTVMDATKERWCEAEVYRIAGAIALMSPEPDLAKAEACFEKALSVARDRQARSFELRAATSMARLWGDQGRRRQARELLAAVCGRFTEGFETGDLRQAQVLLDGLAV